MFILRQTCRINGKRLSINLSVFTTQLEKSTLLEITQWQDNEKCKRTRPCSFQAKLVKYKTEAAEGGSLVEELSAQSRLDQETIRGQRDTIEELRQTAQTDKVMCCVCVLLCH